MQEKSTLNVGLRLTCRKRGHVEKEGTQTKSLLHVRPTHKREHRPACKNKRPTDRKKDLRKKPTKEPYMCARLPVTHVHGHHEKYIRS